MKKHLLFIILFSGILMNNLSAQWAEHSFNLSTMMNVRDIEFIDDNIGLIIGTNSNLKNFIAKTTNGGGSWSIKYNQVDYIEKIAIASPTVIYAIGFNTNYDVVLAKSTNGGDTWTSNILTMFENVVELQFIDANTGFFTDGDDLMKTTDGGVNWNLVNVPQVAGALFNFYFFNANVGYLLAQHYNTYEMEIYKTSNGGASWNKQFTTTSDIQVLNFINENVGVAYDSEEIFYTNNGLNWSKSLIPNYAGIGEIKMVSSKVGFAADADYILKTTDGGYSWNISKEYTAFGPVFPSLLAFPSSSTGYVAGFGGFFAKTSNSGGVGIKEAIEVEYQIFPNPTSENITITYDPTIANDINLNIYNIMGQNVLTKEIISNTGIVNLNISNLSEGTYLLNINNGEKSFYSKVSILR